MKRMLSMATIGAVAVLMSGCEWDGGGGDEGWSTTGIGSDISGTYKSTDGGFAVKTSGSGNVNASEEYGTGNGVAKTYAHTLSDQPVVKSSVSVTGGGESFNDNGSGAMTGSSGGTGYINYDSGAMSITYKVPPSGQLSVSYQYAGSGSSESIYTFTVQQNGNKVRIVTNRGDKLEGTLGVAATSGSSTNAVVSMYQFSASGTSGGKSVTLTGVFDISAGTMQGTWVEEGGTTGSVNAKRS